MIGSGQYPLLSFGLPPDVFAWCALVLALGVLFFPRAPALSGRLWLAALCAAAAGLSWGYYQTYLGGAPRVIDATTYLLEARTFSQGSFSFDVPEPTASFRGRFLVPIASDPTRLAPIFPPGYPALLAGGVLLGAYWAVGPLLAAALVWATYRLATSVTGQTSVGMVAALFSVLCACLRYHTAETMSHGLSTLLATLVVWSTIELRGAKNERFAALFGASLGFLLATRQLTGALFGLACCAALLCGRPPRLWRAALVAGLCMLPGLTLLLLHQRAITGSFWDSPQLRYYGLADGPAGCFELGLGSGCAGEHADVVARQGPLTLGGAARNTLHRLFHHFLDVANFEPLVLVGLYFFHRARRTLSLLPLVLPLVVIPVGYALFYFPGSYPGAGARFFAELLPLWHVAIAAGLVRLGAVRAGIFSCLVGFALHGSFGHLLLRTPHFGPDTAELEALSRTKIGRGLVLVTTAHEFNVAHGRKDFPRVARRTFDDREMLLQDSIAKEGLFEFRSTSEGPQLERLFLDRPEAGTFVFEAEFDYPPEAKADLWVYPASAPLPCVSRGRALALHRDGPHPELTLEARAVPPGDYEISLAAVQGERCVERFVGRLALPGLVQLDARALSDLSHIDRLHLTRTHH